MSRIYPDTDYSHCRDCEPEIAPDGLSLVYSYNGPLLTVELGREKANCHTVFSLCPVHLLELGEKMVAEARKVLGEVIHDYGPGRCEVCGWPLKEDPKDGCVPGNCSYRPREHSEEYRRIRQRREDLKRRDAQKQERKP